MKNFIFGVVATLSLLSLVITVPVLAASNKKIMNYETEIIKVQQKLSKLEKALNENKIADNFIEDSKAVNTYIDLLYDMVANNKYTFCPHRKEADNAFVATERELKILTKSYIKYADVKVNSSQTVLDVISIKSRTLNYIDDQCLSAGF